MSQRLVTLSCKETKVGLSCGGTASPSLHRGVTYPRLPGVLPNLVLLPNQRVNPYFPCVANMMVNGAQITVCWHVDGLNISYRDEEVVSAFAIQIAETYGPKTTI